MKYLKLILIFILFLTGSLLGGNSEEIEYFKPQNIRRFADYLFDEKQYIRAAGEYQRFLFATDSFPGNADSIFFRIALCYRFNENYKSSINYFQKIAVEYKQSGLMEESYLETAVCYSLMDNYGESNKALEINFLRESEKSINTRVKKLITLNYIQLKEWDRATEILDDIDFESSDLFDFVEKGQNLPRKNRFVSGMFSAVIPGSGKYYCDRPMDGLHSFVTTGITTWQAYEGFKADGIHSVKGWIFGVLGGLFYLGNIYGSVVAADIYNEEQEIMFKLSVKKYLDETFK
jgi:tetratricopeptide (TPR) repeat protein